jgi:phenylalanyl-tRNA synthetase beta chain
VAQFVPQHTPISPFPTIERDINLVVQETLRWSDLQRTVRSVAGPELETLAYRETYRDPQKDGPGKKRLLFSMTLRAGERTMTNEEADAIRHRVVSACHEQHQARLLE